MLRQGQWIPTQLIFDCTESGHVKELAYYIRLKGVFSSPIIYNFTYKRLSDILNISTSTAFGIVQRLSALKLVSREGSNLILLSNTKARSIYHNKNGRTKFSAIKKFTNISDIVTYIQYLRVKRNLQAQQYKVRKKATSIPVHKVHLDSKESLNTHIGLSNEGIGRLFAKSKPTGARIQKKLNQSGLITSERKFENLGKMNRAMFDFLRPQGYYFRSNMGYVFKRLCNSIIPLDALV